MLLSASLVKAEKISNEAESKKMINYTVGWTTPNRHLFEVSIEVDVDTEAEIDFAIPSWRPGRYLIQNYARNVQEFSAVDQDGKALAWIKTDKSTWKVNSAGSSRVKVFYKYFANTLDAGSSLLDDSEAYFNGTNLFMYIPKRRAAPCSLKIYSPENWQTATSLKKIDGLFRASNYDELADSPVICSPSLKIYNFTQASVTYNLAFQGKVAYDIEKLIENVSKIVSAQVKLFGKAPFDSYYFLYHVVPGGRNHGVEHAFSSSMTVPESTFTNEIGRRNFYSLTSHEFFHAWNVKRIMPQVFNPPDYSRETYTKLLWFFEGVTSYYGDLLLRRAGVTDEKSYLNHLERLIYSMQNSPGRLIVSAEEASFDGWLQPDDRENAQISFYDKGELLGLLLDLEIRHTTNNTKSLDDVMRYLNNNFAVIGEGVGEDGIKKAVEKVAGRSFEEFFKKYVSGYEELPYNSLLATVGLQLTEEEDASKPNVYTGLKMAGDEKNTILSIIPGSPAEDAGIARGDLLLAIDDRQLTPSNYNEILSSYRPGDRLQITLFRRGYLRRFTLTLRSGANTVYTIKPLQQISETQKKTFLTWIN